MRAIVSFVFCVTLALLAPACGQGAAPGASPAQMAHGRGLAATGALLFERHCQKCHGANGEGGDNAPAVLGRATLSASHFETAQDLWNYVAQKMPKDDPGGLDMTQYWEIVTFMVASTGRRKIPDHRLSESNADRVKLANQ